MESFRGARRTADVNRSQSPSATPTVTSSRYQSPQTIQPVTPCTPQPAPPVSQWTPMSIAALGIRWVILDSNDAVVVRSRPSGRVYALRQSADTTASNSKGWRLYQESSRVLLVPTNATRSKTNWLLDTKESKRDSLLVWRQAGKVMEWIPSPGTLRESTLRTRADRQVARLSPAPSPPAPKRGKAALQDNDGCHCVIGSACQRLRMRSVDTLPAVDPRLKAYPVKTKVCMYTLTHIHK